MLDVAASGQKRTANAPVLKTQTTFGGHCSREITLITRMGLGKPVIDP
jgi:hypothetical protein